MDTPFFLLPTPIPTLLTKFCYRDLMKFKQGNSTSKIQKRGTQTHPKTVKVGNFITSSLRKSYKPREPCE